jgi:outer membrane protein OmpA-like peptidoglycan-associated protein
MGEPFFAVAPTDVAEERNTLRAPLVPFASWQLDDSHFAFDSSLLLPSMTADLAELVGMIRAHPGAKLAVFGHADPTGQDEYNKVLSGRRAMALYGLLTRRTDLFEHLYSQAHGGDDWKKQGMALGTMRAHLGEPDGPAGTAGQRAALFDRYMTAICRDGDGKAFGLRKTAFLGQGADSKGKGDYQGCGEFNPLVVFSTAEAARFSRPEHKAERDRENTANRRVTVFLFAADTRIEVSRWPCPRATEGTAGCRKRFWSDATTRRANQAERRTHPAATDTFACRFYDRFGLDAAPRSARLLLCQLHDPLLQPVRNTAAFVGTGAGDEIETRTDREGWVTCMVPADLSQVAVRYRAESTDVEYVVTVTLPPRPAADEERYLAHIKNLGYGRPGEPAGQTIVRFQAAHPRLTLTGTLDPPTRAEVDRALAAPLRPPEAPGGADG